MGIARRSFSEVGGLAQLARALDLHSRGQGFDSLILHSESPSQPPQRGGEREEREDKKLNKVIATLKKRQNVQKKIDILNFSKSLELEARGLKLRKDKAGA